MVPAGREVAGRGRTVDSPQDLRMGTDGEGSQLALLG